MLFTMILQYTGRTLSSLQPKLSRIRILRLGHRKLVMTGTPKGSSIFATETLDFY